MHILRQTPRELVVVAGSRWVSAICAAGALFTLYVAITRHQPKNLFGTAFFLVCALIMDLRKTFTFDAMQRVVRWKGRTVLKAESGEIPFDDITDIGTESKCAGNNVPVFRLTIVTPGATIPMAYTYNGQPDGYATLRGQILDFVKPGSSILSPEPERGTFANIKNPPYWTVMDSESISAALANSGSCFQRSELCQQKRLRVNVLISSPGRHSGIL